MSDARSNGKVERPPEPGMEPPTPNDLPAATVIDRLGDQIGFLERQIVMADIHANALRTWGLAWRDRALRAEGTAPPATSPVASEPAATPPIREGR